MIQRIEGVSYTKLKKIEDEKGCIFHHLNYLSPSYIGYQESYISKTYSNVIKAWKLHTKMTQNISVPYGKFKFVLIDMREESKTFKLINEFILDDNLFYYLLTIPSNIYYGFKCLNHNHGLIFNVTNYKFDPEESIRIPIENNILPPYVW